MPEYLVLFLMTRIKKVAVLTTIFVTKHLDTDQGFFSVIDRNYFKMAKKNLIILVRISENIG